MRRNVVMPMLLASLLLLSGCSILPSPSGLIQPPEYIHKLQDSPNELEIVANSFLPEGTAPFAPTNPEKTEAIQYVDIDRDGKDEIFVTYRYLDKNKGTGYFLLKYQNGEWVKRLGDEFLVDRIDWATVQDVTGDNNLEILTGVGLDEHYLCRIYRLANEPISIYRGEYSYLKPIQSVDTGKMLLVFLTKQDQHFYAGDTIKGLYGKVLTWNGEEFVLAEDAYSEVYSTLAPYYRRELDKSETSVIAAYYYGEWLVNCHKSHEAMEWIRVVRDNDSILYENYAIKSGILEAQALIQLSKLEEAEKIIEELIRGINDDTYAFLKYKLPQLYLIQGKNYMKAGQLNAAKGMFERCIQENAAVRNQNQEENVYWDQSARMELDRIEQTLTILNP